jgi:opacity protein-like surface antigen
MKTTIILLLMAMGTFSAYGQTKVAVYVAGQGDVGTRRVFGTKLVDAFNRDGAFTAVDRTADFLAEVKKQQGFERSVTVDESQFRELGKHFGVQIVCVAELYYTLGSNHVTARLVNVDADTVMAQVNHISNLNSIPELEKAANTIYDKLMDIASGAYAIRQQQEAERLAQRQAQKQQQEAERAAKKQQQTAGKQGQDVPEKQQEIPQKNQSKYHVHGFQIMAGGGIDMDFESSTFNLSAGYRFNPYLFLGAGAAVFAGIYYDDYYGYEESRMDLPAFVITRVNVLKGMISPYAEIAVGLTIIDNTGFYYSLGAGVDVRLSSKFAVNIGADYTGTVDFSGLFFKAGISITL